MTKRRNNLERTRPPAADSPVSTPTPNQSAESLFSFVTPTEFVELPSRGRFYAEEHPLCGCETVEIKHMTAKEEDILTSQTLLKKGLAINRLVSSILVNKDINPDDLLLGDKNAILIAARISGFGPFYNVNATCPACREQQETVFNLEEVAPNYAQELPSDIEVCDDGRFVVILPNSEVTITVKLLTSRDEAELAQKLETKKKLQKVEATITDLLKSIIVGVEEHTDPSSVHKFIEMMPLKDVNYLRTQYDQLKPDMDLKFDFECSSCSHIGRVVMPMTAQFFWPRQ